MKTRLADKIKIIVEAEGIHGLLCDNERERDCDKRDIGKYPEKYLGHRHCFHQIPYFDNMVLKNMCLYDIDAYTPGFKQK